MGAGVIAPVIEFSSLDSAPCVRSPSPPSPPEQTVHIQTIASLRESFRRCRREQTAYGTISDAVKYDIRISIMRGSPGPLPG